MTQDGIEVAEYLKSHLDKKKIILIGGSSDPSWALAWRTRGPTYSTLMSA